MNIPLAHLLFEENKKILKLFIFSNLLAKRFPKDLLIRELSEDPNFPSFFVSVFLIKQHDNLK